MRRLAVIAALVLALAACGGEEPAVTLPAPDTTPAPDTGTVPEEPDYTAGLPAPVVETHAALLAAARSGDYEELRPLVPAEFSYTFGLPHEGGAIEYWQDVEAEGNESPIEILARLLELPPTEFAGIYVWPFAYDRQEDELTEAEREQLGDLAVFVKGTGYLGWRAGIAPDGTWQFFIAGD